MTNTSVKGSRITQEWIAQGPGPILNGLVENLEPNFQGGDWLGIDAEGNRNKVGEPRNEVVGAIHSVAAHRDNANILYAGGVNGGIWKTKNAKEERPHWEPLTDDQLGSAIRTLEFDTQLEQRNSQADSSVGISIYPLPNHSGFYRENDMK